jgi:endonuclease/exonuclease/phosphatase family metal-dependent hydrolase
MLFNLVRLTGFVTDPLLDDRDVHGVVGEPSRIDTAPPEASQIKFVSWNIAQGVEYDRVRDALVAMDADVYILQEVDRGVKRTDYRDVARDLAHDLGMNWVFAGEFQEIGQARRNVPAITGQALLSRFPISNPHALRFENQANLRWKLDPLQPRRGGRMALRAETAGVIVYNAHIESAKNDRFRHKQVDEMLADHDRSGRAAHPVIVAGDFNTARSPEESVIVRCLIDEGFVDALAVSDAPRQTSIRHEQPLDWIFIRNMEPRKGRVVTLPGASDHFPLEASVSLQPPLVLDAN